jgi:hypothetical protein
MRMGHGTIPAELDILLLCKEMKWTYPQCMDQPRWFVECMLDILRADTQKANKDAKKANK